MSYVMGGGFRVSTSAMKFRSQDTPSHFDHAHHTPSRWMGIGLAPG